MNKRSSFKSSSVKPAAKPRPAPSRAPAPVIKAKVATPPPGFKSKPGVIRTVNPVVNPVGPAVVQPRRRGFLGNCLIFIVILVVLAVIALFVLFN